MSDLFEIVGVKPELAEQQVQKKENRWYDTIPPPAFPTAC